MSSSSSTPTPTPTPDNQRESSTRIKDSDKKRVLDEATRKRRARKALENLERDNFHDDPHADLVMSKKIPKFQDHLIDPRNRKLKRKTIDSVKPKFKKSFQQLLEDMQTEAPNYNTARVRPSKRPPRRICAVCGFKAIYTCVACGTRFCCVRCYRTHQETRCLKWTQ